MLFRFDKNVLSFEAVICFGKIRGEGWHKQTDNILELENKLKVLLSIPSYYIANSAVSDI